MTTATASTSFHDHSTMNLAVLASLTVDELDSLYREARTPTNLRPLNGSPKGRMLAVRGLDKTPLFGPLAGLAKTSAFPWDGKSFTAQDDQHGSGINRINLTIAKQNWFPFETSIAASVIDGRDCILLDYDLPQNPWFIRKIRDELREVSPGLFFGPAMWKDGQGGAALVLWFAIDTTNP